MSALFTLLYLYDPWMLHFFRMAFFIGLIAISLLIIQIYRKNREYLFLPKNSLTVLVLLIGLSSIPMLAHGTKDFSVVIQYCKSFILFIFGVAIYNLFYIDNKQRIITDLKFGISIQAIIGFCSLLGIPFMVELALSSNVLLPRFYGSEQEYRLYNLTSSAFFQLSIFYLLLLHFLLAYNHKHNNIHPIFIFLLLFIGVISGRTFLMLSLISIIIYFRLRYIPVLALFSIICIFLALNYAEHKYVAHALEPLINLFAKKSSVTLSSSTDTLVQKHLFIPELKQILFGDGYYYAPTGGYYGGTDSGFLRQLLYGGVGYLVVCFLFTAYFVIKIAKYWFNMSLKFILSTLIILTILNIKADTYAYPGIMMVLLMFLSLFSSSKNDFFLLKKKGLDYV